jgi:hypothetical protein
MDMCSCGSRPLGIEGAKLTLSLRLCGGNGLPDLSNGLGELNGKGLSSFSSTQLLSEWRWTSHQAAISTKSS